MVDVPANLAFDIRVTDGCDQTLARWAVGSRLSLEETLFEKAVVDDHPILGTVSRLGSAASLDGMRLADHGIVHAEFDLQPDHQHGILPIQDGTQEQFIAAILRWAWGNELADELCAEALASPLGPISSRPPSISSALAEKGWSSSDLWLLTSISPITDPDRTPWCLRGARLIFGEPGLLVVWHPLAAARGWHHGEARDFVTPLPECHRRHSQLARIHGDSGRAHAGRLVQDALQHQEWTQWQLTQRVEAWERAFFSTARRGAFFEGFDTKSLGANLDEIHRLLAELRKVMRDYERRARLGWFPNPDVSPLEREVDSLSEEIQIRSRQIQDRVEDLNGSLREGWTLLASAASGYQVHLQQRLQDGITLVTALVLVPGLVVSLYGANVLGLPGEQHHAGLVAIGAYAAVGAAATGGTLSAFQRGRRRIGYAVLAVGALAVFLLSASVLHGLS